MRVQNIVRTSRSVEVGVVDERFPPDWKRQHDGTVAPLGRDGIEQGGVLRWSHVVDAFAIIRDKGVPVDEAADTLWGSVGDPGDDHAAIAVANENDVLEVLLGHIIDD